MATGINLDGRLEVFVATSKAGGSDAGLWHTWQLAPNGSWSEWTPLATTPVAVASNPAVAKNKDGRFERSACFLVCCVNNSAYSLIRHAVSTGDVTERVPLLNLLELDCLCRGLELLMRNRDGVRAAKETPATDA